MKSLKNRVLEGEANLGTSKETLEANLGSSPVKSENNDVESAEGFTVEKFIHDNFSAEHQDGRSYSFEDMVELAKSITIDDNRNDAVMMHEHTNSTLNKIVERLEGMKNPEHADFLCENSIFDCAINLIKSYVK